EVASGAARPAGEVASGAARPAGEVASGAARPAGEVVLDAGCGEGYGLRMLADAGARRVVGVDLEASIVAHAEATYAAGSGSIEVHAAELMSLPLDDDEVDVTVSFQVIEHLHDIPGYLASLRRVTRPRGEIVIATPNRLTFTPDSDVPVNPFHTREFTAAELTAELEAAGLTVATVLGVHHGRRLRAVEAATRRPFPDLLTASPPDAWPAWLQRLVPRVRASWFELRTDDLDASLDLVAVCRVPG
ncbi:MAG: methyltransferase domain-containing protein, partial [Actinobacteria bacterium]|nr:methyltransferase domain-containing protein [Actinomycetota bacterium]